MNYKLNDKIQKYVRKVQLIKTSNINSRTKIQNSIDGFSRRVDIFKEKLEIWRTILEDNIQIKH